MKEQNKITIRSSAAEYLTLVAATGDSQEHIEPLISILSESMMTVSWRPRQLLRIS